MRALLLAAAFLVGVVCGCTGLAALDGRAQSLPSWEVQQAIESAAARYGLAPRFLYCLARAESGYRPLAFNRAGPYYGLYQFSGPTWAYGSHLAGLPHESPFSAWAASEVAALLLARGERWRWPPARWCGPIAAVPGVDG